MRYQELIELRKGAMGHLKQRFPNTPEYVLQDFVYKHYKNQLDSIEPEIEEWLQELSWKKVNLEFSLSKFDSFTQNRLKQLVGDGDQTQDPRYATQSELVKSKGISGEPIIVTQEDGELELQEGWHRVVAALKQHGEGFTIPAWLGQAG